MQPMARTPSRLRRRWLTVRLRDIARDLQQIRHDAKSGCDEAIDGARQFIWNLIVDQAGCRFMDQPPYGATDRRHLLVSPPISVVGTPHSPPRAAQPASAP